MDQPVVEPPRQMRDCPRWNICSVPICPLDTGWQLRSHIAGEPICIWLTESQKPNAQANFETAQVQDLLPWVQAIAPVIMKRHGSIRRTVEKAATTGSRLEQFAAAGARLSELRSADAPEEIGE